MALGLAGSALACPVLDGSASAGPAQEALTDAFHPDRARESEVPAPRTGGRVIVHLPVRPQSFNSLLYSDSAITQVLAEVHAYLLHRDPVTFEHRPELAESWIVEDALLLVDGTRLFGRIEEREGGVLLSPLSGPTHVLDGPREVPEEQIAAREPETVVTLRLRDNALWHDGHLFDAADVVFSWEITQNPFVDCDATRFEFEKIARAQALDDHTVRFFFKRQHFLMLAVLDGLTLLPRHLYDLADPENPEGRAEFTPEQQGRFVNQHPANQAWVGLGPYRLGEPGDGWIEATRVGEWFDPERAGWVDTIRWRVLDVSQAMQALANGQLDFSAWLSSADYFGEQVRTPQFAARFYTGYFYTPRMSYVVWNTRREQLSSAGVRRALGMCFDWDAYIRSQFRGLGRRVTCERAIESPGYDRELAPLPYDLEAARELLAAEGWYDRDGDGLVDKDGAALELELLVPATSTSARILGAKYAENLASVGVRLRVVAREWAVFTEQLNAREFDAGYLAWNMPVQCDPEQYWHSRWAGQNTSNHAGWVDARSDELIDALQQELDDELRALLLRELQGLIHAGQPYMFGVSVPSRFAMARRVRGFASTALQPGYSIRDWYIVE